MFVYFGLCDLTENWPCSIVLPFWVFSLRETPVSPRQHVLGLSCCEMGKASAGQEVLSAAIAFSGRIPQSRC